MMSNKTSLWTIDRQVHFLTDSCRLLHANAQDYDFTAKQTLEAAKEIEKALPQLQTVLAEELQAQNDAHNRKTDATLAEQAAELERAKAAQADDKAYGYQLLAEACSESVGDLALRA